MNTNLGTRALLAVFLLPAVSVVFADTAERPLYHFTPEVGWMNDPNGLIYVDGEWRMFYQHAPKATGIALRNPWSDKLTEKTYWSWGMATSTDLVHWTHHGDVAKPVPPRTDLTSGCSLLDKDNIFGAGSNAHLIFIEERWGERQTGLSVYTSSDGRTFTPYADNPVFRSPVDLMSADPSIIWHEPTKRWILAECMCDNDPWKVRFWSSPDLKSWQYESEFAGDARDTRRLFLKEFPQLMEFPLEGSSSGVWVLWGGNLRYAIGEFDGHVFTMRDGPIDWQMQPDDYEWWYHPYYTGQTYRNAPNGRYVTQSWLNSTCCSETYSQQMALPLETSVVKTKDGLRLKMLPVRELESIRQGPAKSFQEFDAEGGEIHLIVRPGKTGTVKLNVRGIELGWSMENRRLTASCSRSVVWPLQEEGTLGLLVFVDRQSIEVFAADGLRMRTIPEAIPDPANRSVSVEIGGDAQLVEAKAWVLDATQPVANRTRTNLNQRAAMRDASGDIIVYASQGGLAGCGPEKAFDGKFDTYYYPTNDQIAGTWCGIGFDQPYIITSIDYAGMTITENWWGSERMKDCLIQGASTPDFADAQTLAVLDDPQRSVLTAYTSGAASARPWQYVRIYAPNVRQTLSGCSGGHPVELVFHGYAPDPSGGVPSAPNISNVNVINNHVWFDMTLPQDAIYAEFEYRTSAENTWLPLQTLTRHISSDTACVVDIPNQVGRFLDIRARAVNESGTSVWSEHSLGAIPFVLPGNCIGSCVVLNGNVGSNVRDGDRTTFCSLEPESETIGGWVGIDFGRTCPIAGFRFLPPTGGDSWRDYLSNFAAVEVANKEDFSDAVIVYDIPKIPSTTSVSTVVFGQPVEGRYVRFRARLNERICSLSELEFFTTDDFAATLTPSGLMVGVQ